jgi:hypothetical protein
MKKTAGKAGTLRSGTFDAVVRSVFGISAPAIRLLSYRLGKCRDSDFIAGRICGTWKQPQQTATAPGISTRVLNKPANPPEVPRAGLITNTAITPSRIGRKAISDYFTLELSLALHHSARKHDIRPQALIAEAFNDVLRKYGESPVGE